MLITKREPDVTIDRDKVLVSKSIDDAAPQGSGGKGYDHGQERTKHEFYRPAEQQDFRSALNAWRTKQVDANETIFNLAVALAAKSLSKSAGSTTNIGYRTQSNSKPSTNSSQQISAQLVQAEPRHSNGYNNARNGWTFTARAPNYIPGPSTTDTRELFVNGTDDQDDSSIATDCEVTDYSGWKDYGASASHQPAEARAKMSLAKSPWPLSKYTQSLRNDRSRSTITSQDPSSYLNEAPHPIYAQLSSPLHDFRFESRSSTLLANRGITKALTGNALTSPGENFNPESEVYGEKLGDPAETDGALQQHENQDDYSELYKAPVELLSPQSRGGMSPKYDASSQVSQARKYSMSYAHEDRTSWDPNIRHQLVMMDPSPAIDYDSSKKTARKRRQYSLASANADMDKIVAYQPPIRSNTKSSKSNSNVSFGSKRFSPLPLVGDEDSNGEECGIETFPHEAVLLQAKQQKEDKQTKKLSGLFAEDPSRKAIQSHTTDLSHLNFSTMNANIRRSRDVAISQLPLTAKYATLPNSSTSFEGSRMVIDNTHKEKSSYPGTGNPNIARQKSSLKSKSSFRLGDSASDEFSASNGDMDDPPVRYSDVERERTTILLAKEWSGLIQVEGHGKGSSRAADGGSNPFPSYKPKNSKQAFPERDSRPHTDPQVSDSLTFNSYQTIEEVWQRLADLDRKVRLQKNRKSGRRTRIFSGSTDWMTDSGSWTSPTDSRHATPGSTQAGSSLYRTSGCPKSKLPVLSDHLNNTSLIEDQNMRENFYSHLRKVVHLVNVMTLAIPRDLFPFEIKPTSIHGSFERRGPRSVDMYLMLEHPNLHAADVQFTFDKELSAEILMPFARGGLEKFSIHYKNDSVARLSASKLMIVFSYIMNTTIRQIFEADEQNWTNPNSKYPFSAAVLFQSVSEEKVVIDMTFLENENQVTYHVGLFLAVDIESSFPNVLEIYGRRQWPTGELKNELEQNGVHLISKVKSAEQHTWHVSFLKARKLLLEKIDYDGASKSLLLALQVLREKTLSRPGVEVVLIPMHFVTLLLWVHSQMPAPSSWESRKLGERFIDILIALKRCLERKECRDFFLPNMNFFAGIPLGILNQLSDIVECVIKEPFSYI